MSTTTLGQVKHPACPTWCTQPANHDPDDLERPKAKEAMTEGQERGRAAQHGKLVSVPANEDQKKKFDTREVVAPAVGMSTATYSRAKQLVAAAEWLEVHQ